MKFTDLPTLEKQLDRTAKDDMAVFELLLKTYDRLDDRHDAVISGDKDYLTKKIIREMMVVLIDKIEKRWRGDIP